MTAGHTQKQQGTLRSRENFTPGHIQKEDTLSGRTHLTVGTFNSRALAVDFPGEK